MPLCNPKVGPQVVRAGTGETASGAVPSAHRSAAGQRRQLLVMPGFFPFAPQEVLPSLWLYWSNDVPLKKTHPKPPAVLSGLMNGLAPKGLSHSALTAAAARAAHLIVAKEPFVFADTLAAALLGARAAEPISYHRLHGGHPVLAGARAQVTCRSRYADDCLAAAAGRGRTQYGVLRAGLH